MKWVEYINKCNKLEGAEELTFENKNQTVLDYVEFLTAKSYTMDQGRKMTEDKAVRDALGGYLTDTITLGVAISMIATMDYCCPYSEFAFLEKQCDLTDEELNEEGYDPICAECWKKFLNLDEEEK